MDLDVDHRCFIERQLSFRSVLYPVPACADVLDELRHVNSEVAGEESAPENAAFPGPQQCEADEVPCSPADVRVLPRHGRCGSYERWGFFLAKYERWFGV